MRITAHPRLYKLRNLSPDRVRSQRKPKAWQVIPRRSPHPAFTIVELLIVIVVIAILAAISIVAYNGIQERARSAALKSDLTQVNKQLKLFQADNGSYPATVTTNCTTALDSATNKCLQVSSGKTISSYDSTNAGQGYNLTLTNDSSSVSRVLTDSQAWATKNLNVGTRIAGTASPSNNGTIEKYCYNDDEANCTTYGALYTWDEAMQYSTSPGAQGICPSGSHIPTDEEWKTLEMSLGMTQTLADTTGWRGTDQGTQLKAGGASGLNIPLAGNRSTAGSFANLGSYAYVWSSSESGGSAWSRTLLSGNATVYRYTVAKAYGFSVRCLEN